MDVTVQPHRLDAYDALRAPVIGNDDTSDGDGDGNDTELEKDGK